MKIQIPKDISDPNLQEICRQVFTEICGGRITDEEIIDGSVIIRKYERWKIPDLIDFPGYVNLFNPFTRIQDTKLCDRWLVENKLRMYTDFEPVTNSWEVMVRPWDWNFPNVTPREFGHAADYSEPFARMVAIILAFNKLEEK